MRYVHRLLAMTYLFVWQPVEASQYVFRSQVLLVKTQQSSFAHSFP